MMKTVTFSKDLLVCLATLTLLSHVSASSAAAEAIDYDPPSACVQGLSVLHPNAAMSFATALIGSPFLNVTRARFLGPCESLQYSALPNGHLLRRYTSAIISLSVAGTNSEQQLGDDASQHSSSSSSTTGSVTLQMAVKVSPAAPKNSALVLGFTTSGGQPQAEQQQQEDELEEQHKAQRNQLSSISIIELSSKATSAGHIVLPDSAEDLQVGAV